jgi:hypothetical protein
MIFCWFSEGSSSKALIQGLLSEILLNPILRFFTCVLEIPRSGLFQNENFLQTNIKKNNPSTYQQ